MYSMAKRKQPETKPSEDTPKTPAPKPGDAAAAQDKTATQKGEAAHPDPTRYGDWEIKGRCIDF